MENTPLGREEVAAKNSELREEHLRIAAAQHNANIVSIFAPSSESEAIDAARRLVDSTQELQDDHIREAREFVAENLPTLTLLAEEEDQMRQDLIDAARQGEADNRKALEKILSKVLRRPFDRAALIGERESILTAYCTEKGVSREELSLQDMMTIADTPEWIAAHPDGEGGFGYTSTSGVSTVKF